MYDSLLYWQHRRHIPIQMNMVKSAKAALLVFHSVILSQDSLELTVGSKEINYKGLKHLL